MSMSGVGSQLQQEREAQVSCKRSRLPSRTLAAVPRALPILKWQARKLQQEREPAVPKPHRSRIRKVGQELPDAGEHGGEPTSAKKFGWARVSGLSALASSCAHGCYVLDTGEPGGELASTEKIGWRFLPEYLHFVPNPNVSMEAPLNLDPDPPKRVLKRLRVCSRSLRQGLRA